LQVQLKFDTNIHRQHGGRARAGEVSRWRLHHKGAGSVVAAGMRGRAARRVVGTTASIRAATQAQGGKEGELGLARDIRWLLLAT
jgi:hypothetical protein